MFNTKKPNKFDNIKIPKIKLDVTKNTYAGHRVPIKKK
jgi:hypothetical protein